MFASRKIFVGTKSIAHPFLFTQQRSDNGLASLSIQKQKERKWLLKSGGTKIFREAMRI